MAAPPGNFVGLNLGPLYEGPASHLPLNLGVDWWEDAPEPPPDPEVVGDLVMQCAAAWGGLVSRRRSARLMPARLSGQRTIDRVRWGAVATRTSATRAAWGGLLAHLARRSGHWRAAGPGLSRAAQVPWQSIPPVRGGSHARWQRLLPLLRDARGLPWSVPPVQRAARGVQWGGWRGWVHAMRLPWSAPPKQEFPLRIPWGYGNGLEWVVLPPPAQPPDPPPGGAVDGRYVGLNLGCAIVGVPGLAPLNLGITACYVVRRQRKAYVVLNTIEVVRLPDELPIAVDAVSLSSSRDSWCWDARLQLVDPAQLADVQPTAAGPRQLRITLNGYVWVIAVESFDESREFGRLDVRLAGRSVTAQLAEPYAAARSHETTAVRSMVQLAEAELSGSDITAEYDTVSWLVPAGAWYYDSMTPMSALVRIAAGSGGVVQSHASLPEVRIAPRYPVSPWAWPDTTPDVEIQDDIITATRLQLQSRPQYDAVIVAGERVGVAARVKRDGEAGQTYAPQQIDQLITHADGARERGRNVLSDRGGQALIDHDIPLFPAPLSAGQPGLVLPLQLVRREAVGGAWHGIATAVTITATRQDKAVDIQQTVTLERHYTDAD